MLDKNSPRKRLCASLYCYVEPINCRRAKIKAASFGSFSNYVNSLIAKDHGDKKSFALSMKAAEEYLEPTEYVRKTKGPIKKMAVKKTAAKGKGSKKSPKPKKKKYTKPAKRASRENAKGASA